MGVTQEPARKFSWARQREDERHKFAGRQLRRSASLQKLIARARHESTAWVSRQCSGDRTGAVQRFYDLVSDLTTDSRTSPASVIAGALAVAHRSLGDLPDAELYRRLGKVLEAETRAQAEEDVATFRVQDAWRLACEGGAEAWEAYCRALEAWEEALMQEMSSELEALVVSWEIRRRQGCKA